MASVELLREKHNTILALYRTHRETVLALQQTLYDDILPNIAEELALDEWSLQSAKEWVSDHGSIFRMLKKYKFRETEARVALYQTLHWRISVLAPLQAARSAGLASFIQCLPRHAQDVIGHPILLIKLAGLPGTSVDIKHDILREYDVMRRRLWQSTDCDVCQCLIMVDFKEARIRGMPVNLIPWFLGEVAPHFPGLCAGVLIVNYTWAYSGILNLVRRLLPSSALDRIIFLTESELLSYFDQSRLPQDYGGSLDLSSPSHADTLINIVHSTSPPYEDPPQHTYLPHVNLAKYLPATSLLNPFYGYPAVAHPGSSTPQLKNGRRRKRDLARTLALLWLAKLKRTADRSWLWIIMTLTLWVARLRSNHARNLVGITIGFVSPFA